VLAGVSSDADKCRIMPDASFTQVLDKPAAAALSAHGYASCLRMLAPILRACLACMRACLACTSGTRRR